MHMVGTQETLLDVVVGRFGYPEYFNVCRRTQEEGELQFQSSLKVKAREIIKRA